MRDVRSVFRRALTAAVIAMITVPLVAFAQTNPTPQSVPFTENFGTLLHTSTTYPAGLQGWINGAPGAAFLTTGPTANAALLASGSSTSTTGGVQNYNGKIGPLDNGTNDYGLAIAINTTGITGVVVDYDAMTLRNPYDGTTNTRINELVLQYRVGVSGAWTTLAATAYQNNTTTQTTPSVTTPQNLQARSETLPAACNNEAVVQLRFAQRQVSGGGSRPGLAVDNISIHSATHTLTYTAGANGTISGASPQVVAHGASGTLVTAVPDPGYSFVSWSDGVLTASRTEIGVTADVTVTASFAINTYTLTYTAGANGSILGTSPQVVNQGADGTPVTAVPDPGYSFVSWSDGVLTASRTEIGVTGDVTVTASFAINTYTLTYSAGANGSILGTSPQVVNHGADGTPVTAVPDPGYNFVSWSDGVLTASRTEIGVTGDVTVTASFAINTYTLTYSAGANGSILGTSPQVVNHGADGTPVTAVPDPGYNFVSWSDGVLTASRTEIGVTGDVTVSASFAINTYTLTYSAGANGSILGTSPQVVNHGADGTAVTAVPDPGYSFVSWSDGVLTASRTEIGVTGDVTVSASFAINTYTLTYSAGANGSILGTSPQVVNHGADGTPVTAVPDPGYNFVSWSDGVLTASRTEIGVAGDVTVSASFAINTYTLTYTAGANGSISGSNPQVVAHGGDGTPVTAVPDPGYSFVSWSDGVLTAIRTEIGVTGDVTVSASFAINTYTLTYTAGANGSILGTSPQAVNHGADGTPVTAVPDPGYSFVSWSDGVLTATRTEIGVTGDVTVSASFALNTYTLTYTAGANGSISGTNPQIVAHGADGTLVTAVPDPGYSFSSWSDGVLTAARIEINVTANVSVTASFVINSYTLTYTAGANGSISGSSPQVVNHGANGTPVTAVPDPGYGFVSWSDGVLTATRTETGVTGNVTVSASFAPEGIIVISQVHGGGGNAGSTFKNDFIELFNRGGAPVSVTGWSVQYASATGAVWQPTPLSGSIAAGGYYLVQEAAGTGGTLSLPTPDATGSIAMNAVSGKVVVVSSTTALSGTCPSGGGIMDLVGYGTANCFETAAVGVLNNTTAARRNSGGCVDTDNNASDISLGAPTPRNTASPTNSCLNTLAVSVNPAAGGSVTKVPDLPIYLPGENVLLTAVHAPGYHFIGWTGDASGSANPITVTMNGSKTIVAHFRLNGVAGQIAISQVYGGGGNAGAPYRNDYIELYNRGNATVDITGWTLQYAAFDGSTWSATNLIGSIAPGRYYLIQQAEGMGGIGGALPTPDAIGTTTMGSVSGKVALVSNAITLTAGCPTGPEIVDFLGYGIANCSEGLPSGDLGNATAGFRDENGCIDTGDNLADFGTGSPAPRNSSSPVNICNEWLAVDATSDLEFAMGTVSPNPTRGAMRIPFSMPREAEVRLRVLDLQGRVVASVAEGVFPAGRHEVLWTGMTRSGSARSGIYFIQMNVAGRNFVRRIAITN